MKALRHTLDDGTENEGQLHAPGSFACDFQTLCGSCWNDGEFIEVNIKSAKQITCEGCLDVIRVAKPYISALSKKRRGINNVTERTIEEKAKRVIDGEADETETVEVAEALIALTIDYKRLMAECLNLRDSIRNSR